MKNQNPSIVSASGSFKELSGFSVNNPIKLNINEIEHNLLATLEQFGVNRLIEALPFQIKYFWGKDTLNEVLRYMDYQLKNPEIYNVFSEYLKKSKAVNEVTTAIDPNEEVIPYAFQLIIADKDENDEPKKPNKGIAFDSLKVYTSNDTIGGMQHKINLNLNRLLQGDNELYSSKINSADLALTFRRFIVAYYYALAELLIEERIDVLDEDEPTEVPIESQKFEDVLKKALDNEEEALAEKEEKTTDKTDKKEEKKDTKSKAETNKKEEEKKSGSEATYGFEIAILINKYKAVLSAEKEGSDSKTFTGEFIEPITIDDVQSMGVDDEIKKELPAAEEPKDETIAKFTLKFDERAIIIWFELSRFKIGMSFRDKQFFYMGFELEKNEKGEIVTNNVVEEGLKFLRINKASILYKKDPSTKVDLDILDDDLVEGSDNIFEKDFLDDYNLVVGASINLRDVALFKPVGDAINTNSVTGYLAMRTGANNKKLALIINVPKIGNQNYNLTDLNIKGNITLGGNPAKDFGLAIGAKLNCTIDGQDAVFHILGKVYTTGFELSGSVSHNVNFKITDTLYLSELGILFGYDTITQFAVGFQGRVISNNGSKSASLFAATHMNIIGKAIKLNMFSIAIAPSGNKPVTIASLISNMFGVPEAIMPPYFHLIAVGDILVNRGKQKSNQDKSLALATRNNLIIEHFNNHIVDELKINEKQLDNIAIKELDTEYAHLKNYLITDHNRKIHYKIDYEGNLYLNSQFYACIAETQIGANKYEKGLFAAALIKILGQEFKIMLSIDGNTLEAYASMKPINLFGILKVEESIENRNNRNNNKYITKSNGLFKQVMKANTEEVGGPEVYLKIAKPNNENFGLFELKAHGRVSLLNIFNVDAYIHIGDQIKLAFAMKLLNFNLSIKYAMENDETKNQRRVEFSFLFQTSEFADTIRELQQSITRAVQSTQQSLQNAKRRIEEQEAAHAAEMRRLKERERAEQARIDRMGCAERALHGVMNFLNNIKNEIVSLSRKVAKVMITVAGALVEAGGAVINGILSAVGSLISLLGKIISLNKLYISSTAVINTQSPSLNYNLKAEIGISLFGKEINTGFQFGFTFTPNVNLIQAVKNELTKTVSGLIKGSKEYLDYERGKDEQDPISFKAPEPEEYAKILNGTKLELTNYAKIEEYKHFMDDIFNNPSNLKKILDENKLSEEEAKKFQDLIDGNFDNPVAELDSLLRTIKDDEFQEHLNTIKDTVETSDSIDPVIKESVKSLDAMLKQMDEMVNSANIARTQILQERSDSRNERKMHQDAVEAAIKMAEYDALREQLQSGETPNLHTEEAKEQFREFALQLDNVADVRLAIAALDKFYMD